MRIFSLLIFWQDGGAFPEWREKTLYKNEFAALRCLQRTGLFCWGLVIQWNGGGLRGLGIYTIFGRHLFSNCIFFSAVVAMVLVVVTVWSWPSVLFVVVVVVVFVLVFFFFFFFLFFFCFFFLLDLLVVVVVVVVDFFHDATYLGL